jgi:hypothetical protein
MGTETHPPAELDLDLRVLAALPPQDRCERIRAGLEIPATADAAELALAYFIDRGEPLDLLEHVIPQGATGQEARYRLEVFLGGGGFGRTFQAERLLGPLSQREALDASPPLYCAVKILMGADGAGHDGRLNAAKEIRNLFLAANRPHRNVIMLMDFGETSFAGASGVFAFVVSPLVPRARAINVFLQRLPAIQKLAVYDQFLDGLAHVHGSPIQGGLGLAHLDLHPRNILVDESGIVRIIDLGLATSDRTRVSLGAIGYASPEQRGISGRDIGPASDVYSAGIILHELLCEQYKGPHEDIRIEDWPGVDDLSTCQRGGLLHLIAVCIRDDAQTRFADARILREEFLRILTRVPPRSALADEWPTPWVAPFREDLLHRIGAECPRSVTMQVARDCEPCLRIADLASGFAESVPSIEYLRTSYAPATARYYCRATGAVHGCNPDDVDYMQDSDGGANFEGRSRVAWDRFLRACWRRSPQEFVAALLLLPDPYLPRSVQKCRNAAVSEVARLRNASY